MTADGPINLNKARKDRQKAERRAQADANSVKFGRTKAQKVLEAAQNERARRKLDEHRFDDE